MNAKYAYREFLKSDFWLELSARKKESVGKCERCGDTKRLQAHHKIYRKNWYETQPEDLEVLCRSCHLDEHEIPVTMVGPVIIHRDDLQFSRFIYWADLQWNKSFKTCKPLHPSQERYFEMALKLYPPTETDACMEFHVRRLLISSKDLRDRPRVPDYFNPANPKLPASAMIWSAEKGVMVPA